MTRDGGGWTLVGVARFSNRGQAGWNSEPDLNPQHASSLTEHWHLSSEWTNAVAGNDQFRANCFESNNNYLRYWWGVTTYRWGAVTSAGQSWDSYERDGTQYTTVSVPWHYGLVSGFTEVISVITSHSDDQWACGGNAAPGGEGYTGRGGRSNMRIWAK